MSAAIDKPQPYTIRGVWRGDPRSATRLQVASAIVLAMRWAEEGCRDIAIVDGSGKVWEPALLQQHLQASFQRRSGFP